MITRGGPLTGRSASCSLPPGRADECRLWWVLTTSLGSATVLQCGTGNEQSAWLSGRLGKWVADVLGGGAVVVGRRPLHGDDGPWLLRIDRGRGQYQVVLRAPTHRIDEVGIRCNAAALETAASYGIPAPQLLGCDLSGETAGVAATVETVISGTSTWSSPPSADRLRAAGMAIAALHRFDHEPSAQLPYRPRPIAVDDFARDRRLGRMPTTKLLRRADDRLSSIEPPDHRVVFVHGDVWPGNMIWTDASQPILIDWKTAGVGSPGVDLAELRKQISITFGADAPPEVVKGWEHAIGSQATDLPYWDVVAALNTPTVLDSPTFTARRDAFLRSALKAL